MGFIDSLSARASSTVSKAREAVSEVVDKVEDTATRVVEKVETKAASTAQEVKSAFEDKILPKPPPSAPPPTAKGKPISAGAAGLRNALTASIADSLQSPPPSSDAQAAAKALKAKHSSWKGLDEEGLAHDLADLAKKDPIAAAPIIKEVMNTQLDRSDKDDVAEAFAAEMSPDQLKALASHPDGKWALETMEHELRTGYTSGHEAEMATKLKSAVTDADKSPLPNTPVPDMTPGARGVNAGDELKTSTGKIPAEMWNDPSKIVGALTQNPASGSAPGNTCAASSMLASTLMASPEKAARFLENVARSEDAKNLLPKDRNELLGIADRVRNKTASFEDLNKAQGLLFQAGNTHGDTETIAKALMKFGAIPNGVDAQGQPQFKFKNLTAPEETELRGILAKNTAWTDQEVSRLQELTNRATGLSMRMEKVDGNWAPKIEGELATMDPAGFSDAETRKLASMGGLKTQTALGDAQDLSPSTIANRLKPGEAVSFRVAGQDGGDQSNHFITVGRRDDGTLYLYNSDPAKKDATLTVGGKGNGSEDFRKLLSTYDDRQMADPNGKMPTPVPYRID